MNYVVWATIRDNLSTNSKVSKSDVLDILDMVITNEDFDNPVRDFVNDVELDIFCDNDYTQDKVDTYLKGDNWKIEDKDLAGQMQVLAGIEDELKIMEGK